MQHVKVVVRGRVQGVGFRWFVSSTAERLGVAGEVWNRRDGAVELEAEGARQALEAFVEAIRRGPPGARVASAETAYQDGPARHHGFRIGPSR